MKKEFYLDYIKPFVVLVVICLAVALLLGAANAVTAPIIEQNALEKANATRNAVLSGAAGFREVSCDTARLGITGAWAETGGKGYVITAAFKGYSGGLVTVTVGMDPDGRILGVSADVSNQTQGIGSKAGQSTYLDKFLGLSGTGAASSVDTITGATWSSTAVKNGINAALAAFPAVKEAAA